MDVALWCLFHELKFKECYLARYCAYCKRRNDGITIAGLLISSASIAGWFTTHLPALWGILIFAAQIAQIVKPFLNYEKHEKALNFFIPDLASLVFEVEKTWRTTRNAPDDELSDFLMNYRKQYHSLENKYCGVDVIPRINSVNVLATKDTQLFFSQYYNIKWGEPDVKEACKAKPSIST